MISSLYTGLLGLLFFKLSLDTIAGRRKYQIALGPGPNNEIIHLVSAHANFAAYAPVFLFMLYLAEMNQLPGLFLHLTGSLFTVGRGFHYWTMKNQEKTLTPRKIGMHLTLWPLLILSSTLVVSFFLK